MNEDENKNEEKKEETPKWAQNLSEQIANSMEDLKTILTPKQETPTDEPTPIVLPQPPEQETPTPEPITEQETPQEQEKPKKRKFLDWLL